MRSKVGAAVIHQSLAPLANLHPTTILLFCFLSTTYSQLFVLDCFFCGFKNIYLFVFYSQFKVSLMVLHVL